MNLEACKTMIKENTFCVLSTSKDNAPNSSLMLYLPQDDGTKLYLITLRGSLKHQNITENPQVSLLIDTRRTDHEQQVKALTVYGLARILDDTPETMTIMEEMVTRHPSLGTIAKNRDACIVEVAAARFLYLDGVNDLQHLVLG